MRILILSFLVIPSFLYSQNYKSMANHVSEWHLTTCNFSCLQDVYYIDGDTTYQDKDYKILNGFHFISRTFWIRENVSAKKVYLSFVQGTKRFEDLLYDFSLTVGDSINLKNPVSPFPYDAGYFKVDSIVERSIYNGDMHRFFYLSPSVSNSSDETPVWVEGIGSLSMINAPGAGPSLYGAGKLSCHFDDGELIYTQMDSIEACNASFIFADFDKNYLESNVQVLPSMVDDFVTIQSNIGLSTIAIYNSLGQIVLEVNPQEKLLLKIDLSKFIHGLYFIRISSKKHGEFSKRLIKM